LSDTDFFITLVGGANAFINCMLRTFERIKEMKGVAA